MVTLKNRTVIVLASLAVIALLSQSAFGAAATFKKSVIPMEDGNYLIKIKVEATSASIYGLMLIDPEASIINIYSPRGWCVVTDGGDLLARSSSDPIKTGKPVEFIIHSSSDKVNYTWAAFDLMKQLGEPGTL